MIEERIGELLDGYDAEHGPDAKFWGRQFDLGLAWVHYPQGEGGLGLERKQQLVVDDALDAAGVPRRPMRSGVGIGLTAPTIAVFGTPEQKSRHLRRIFTGKEIWCQLFSEPGAGSDIATLATKAVRDRDNWIISGQKVWTSLGHAADWGILCARTDPQAPKHKGLTYFLVDMHLDGVDPRPLRQITGDAEFDEVYLEKVVVPDTCRVGDVGAGWVVTLTTLANERAMIGTLGGVARGEGTIGTALDAWARSGDASARLRGRLLELAVEAEVLRITARDAMAAERAGTPSSAWSFLKLATSESDQRILDLTLDLMGPEGLTYDSYQLRVPEELGEFFAADADSRRAFLFARAMTIAGGTSEIQRTIIADRVLQLPREPAADRAVPWSEIPR